MRFVEQIALTQEVRDKRRVVVGELECSDGRSPSRFFDTDNLRAQRLFRHNEVESRSHTELRSELFIWRINL